MGGQLGGQPKHSVFATSMRYFGRIRGRYVKILVAISKLPNIDFILVFSS